MKNLHQIPKDTFSTFGLILLFLGSLTSCRKNQPDISSNSIGRKPISELGTTLSIPTTISDSLIAYWTFSRTTYDLSGNNNTGTVHQVSVVNDRFNHVGGAYSFNGTTSYIQVPDNVSLRLSGTSFTVNAWIKLAAYNSSYGSAIMNKHISGNNNGWAWSITGDSAATKYVQFFGPGGSSSNAYGKDTVGLNGWHMVTSVYNINTEVLKFYKDGVLDDSTAHILPPNAMISTQLYIGRDNPVASSNGYFFDGYMNDIRMYNRAITQSEVTVLFNATTAPTANLLAFWPLTNTANDLSPQKYNGTGNNVSTGQDRFGNPIGAYKFNGTSSYISVPDSPLLRLNNTDFTVNSWIKLVNYNSSYGSAIMNKHTTGNNAGWAWSITGDSATTKYVQFFGPGGTLNDSYGTKVIPTGSWHMVTCIYTLSTSTITFYVDGVLDHSVTGIASPNAYTVVSLYIGRDNPSASANGYFFNGWINDLRIYNRAVSTTEINQLLNCLD